MLFNSIDFLLFFPVVCVVLFLLPKKVQWLWLLITSYYFYMSWNEKYALLILTSTIITFTTGLLINRANEVRVKKFLVFISFFSNLSILFFYKYYDFATETLNAITSKFSLNIDYPVLDVLLPVGISFYTFQALSYTMDVYRGDIKAERHFGKYALFVSFFPQLVAGPIERSTSLLPQFSEKKEFDYYRVRDGLFIMLCGFFKKIVIADRLAVLVDTVYNNPTEYDGFSLIIATIFFSFQIYCDFSAYSDIAIGTAKVMGYDLMDNFKRPYLSKSIGEFWRNWHISLSTWFKDYVYIPLGGNRVSQIRVYRNIFLVFVISGLWHGASWNFIIWGALHGLYLIFEILFKPIKNKILGIFKIKKETYSFKLSQVIKTYFLVCLAWVFFRANSLSDALYILKNTINLNSFNLKKLGLDEANFAFSIFLIIFLISIQLIQRKTSIKEIIYKENLLVRWSVFIFLIITTIFFGYYTDEPAVFIYFQF